MAIQTHHDNDSLEVQRPEDVAVKGYIPSFKYPHKIALN